MNFCKEPLAYLFVTFEDISGYENVFGVLSMIFFTYLQIKKWLNDNVNFNKSTSLHNCLKLDVICNFL